MPSPKTARSHFAVLIGVNDYAREEVAQNREIGASGLRAPTYEAVTWYWVLQRLGVPQENITVLTSPVIGVAEMFADRVACGLAATDPVQAALTDLVDKCAAAGDGAMASVFFMGHGALARIDDPGLYLTDYTGLSDGQTDADLHDRQGDAFATEGRLSVANLSRAMAARAPGATLNVIVDACRGTAADGPCNPDVQAFTSGNHVLVLSTSADTKAYEAVIGTLWRSRFSWAAERVLEGFEVVTEGDQSLYDLSWTTLRGRIGELLAAISPTREDQAPAIVGTPDARALGVGQRAGTTVDAVLHEEPPRSGTGIEFPASTAGTMTTIVGTTTQTGQFGVTAQELKMIPGGSLNPLESQADQWRFQGQTGQIAGLPEWVVTTVMPEDKPRPNGWPTENVVARYVDVPEDYAGQYTTMVYTVNDAGQRKIFWWRAGGGQDYVVDSTTQYDLTLYRYNPDKHLESSSSTWTCWAEDYNARK